TLRPLTTMSTPDLPHGLHSAPPATHGRGRVWVRLCRDFSAGSRLPKRVSPRTRAELVRSGLFPGPGHSHVTAFDRMTDVGSLPSLHGFCGASCGTRPSTLNRVQPSVTP